MTRKRLLLAVLVGSALLLLVKPHLYGDFVSVRAKIVRDPAPVSNGRFELKTTADDDLTHLRAPFATIIHLHTLGAADTRYVLSVDGRDICEKEVAAGASRRIDCAVTGDWDPAAPHTFVVTSATPAEFQVEYFELATHHGALSVGPKDVIIVPRRSTAYQPPSLAALILLFVLFTIAAWAWRFPLSPRPLRWLHIAVYVFAFIVIAASILAGMFGPYTIVIGVGYLVRLSLYAAAPVLIAGARAALVRSGWPLIATRAQPLLVGLLVGAVYTSFAVTRINENLDGNPSGLLLISHQFFDRHPDLSRRADLQEQILFANGGGYDGQFFYMMSFDPFITRFRYDIDQYRAYIDAPPYRYGRIGFSVLARAAALNRDRWVPIAMVALVLISLAICGALVASIARHQGYSSWLGLLIIFVPGFWQSVEGTLPEPVAAAFLLGGYLAMKYRRYALCAGLLAASLLVRETSGALVLAIPAVLWLEGRRREAVIIAVSALGALAAWKGYVGWRFFPAYGVDAFFPRPHDNGIPFAGVLEMWRVIGRGTYFDGMPEMARAGYLYPLLTTAASVLAFALMVARPSPLAAAACVYALLTVTFNYEAVWLHPGNAQRLTIDLFVSLALASLDRPAGQTVTRMARALWVASALYVFFGSFEAGVIRHGAFGILLGFL